MRPRTISLFAAISIISFFLWLILWSISNFCGITIVRDCSSSLLVMRLAAAEIDISRELRSCGMAEADELESEDGNRSTAENAASIESV